jgi:hypothetical protein
MSKFGGDPMPPVNRARTKQGHGKIERQMCGNSEGNSKGFFSVGKPWNNKKAQRIRWALKKNPTPVCQFTC